MQPLHDHIHDEGLFDCCQGSPFRYAMPFLQAVPTAASGSVLSDERREDAMPHGCLTTVVGNNCRCKTVHDDVPSAFPEFLPAFVPDIVAVLTVDVEAAAELGFVSLRNSGSRSW